MDGIRKEKAQKGLKNKTHQYAVYKELISEV